MRAGSGAHSDDVAAMHGSTCETSCEMQPAHCDAGGAVLLTHVLNLPPRLLQIMTIVELGGRPAEDDLVLLARPVVQNAGRLHARQIEVMDDAGRFPLHHLLHELLRLIPV